MKRCCDSKGIESSRGHSALPMCCVKPAFCPSTSRAPSVGSPTTCHTPWSSRSCASLHSTPARRASDRAAWRLVSITRGADAEVADRLVADARHVHVEPGTDHAPHGHLVARQGAGLVRADHGHRAQRLHRGQPAHDGVAPRHALHAEGQRHGHDRRQAFGDGRGGERDDHHEHLGRGVAAPQHAEHEGRRRQRQDGQRQVAAEAVDLAQQRRAEVADACQHAVDLAQLGAAAGGHDDAGGLPVDHQRAGVGHAAAVAERRIGGHGAACPCRPAATRR